MPLTFGDMPQGGYVVMLTALEQDDIRLVGGSVFSVYERVSEPGTVGRDVDLERSGCEQIAAGYVIYAAGTRLYYSIGAGVFGFVLHPMAMQYFQTGGQGVFAKGWDVYGDVRKVAGLGGFVRGKGGRVYETGCVVADFDAAVRNGGLFVAHVHVLCMGFALAYVAEQLEGMAVDMKGRRLLDRCVERGHVHGRVVMLAGCEQVVNSFLQFMKA